MRYKKLVRDKIPEIIEKEGRKPIFHIANKKEYWNALKLKLREEAEEFFEKPNMEELADILEVIYAICDFKKISKKELEKLRKKKEKERGGFKKRIVLDEVKDF
jgi:predicted house-cleaning noncanonical NTP pyrophosphatase (MazG superfamily)